MNKLKKNTSAWIAETDSGLTIYASVSVKNILSNILHRYFQTLVWFAIIFAAIGSGGSIYANDSTNMRTVPVLSDREIQAKVEGLHQHIWKYFYNPQVNLLYDYIAPLQEKDRWGHLPTVEEVNARNPNVSGWGTGMEDGSINGGTYLVGMVYRHEVTGQPEHAEDARKIYEGLRLLGTVSERKGFIARSVLPDGKTYYTNSSVDQYTMYVYGLYTYYHSSIATEKEKAQIRSIMHDICTRIEDDGFDILTHDGKPALVSDIGVIRSDRSSRLLEMYRVGYDVTGDTHWLDIYQEKLAENQYARLRDITTPSRVDTPGKSRSAVYCILQDQASLIPLFELETSLAIRAGYLEAIRLNANLVSDRVTLFREYDPDIHSDNYKLGGWRTGENPRPGGLSKEFNLVRNPCEALVVMLLAHDKYLIEPYPYQGEQDKLYTDYLRNITRELLSTYDFAKMRTFGSFYAEIAYWLAVKQGLFEYMPEK